MVGDSVAQFVVSVKNAGTAGKSAVIVPYSSLAERILEVLQREGFIKSFSKTGKKTDRKIEVELVYADGRPRIHEVRRISRLSKRVYRGSRSLPPYKHGHGIRILSTSKGVLSDKEARKGQVGGEVLLELW